MSQTFASDPGRISMSRQKLKVLRPNLFGLIGFFRETKNFRIHRTTEKHLISEHLYHGDSRAAVVIEIAKFLFVAAYTDEIDCVAILAFPKGFTDRYGVQKGARLLTINSYLKEEKVSPDLVPGPRALGRWQNFSPIIAEFVSDDTALIEKRKAEISDDEWARTEILGIEYYRAHPNWWRAGLPLYSCFPNKNRNQPPPLPHRS